MNTRLRTLTYHKNEKGYFRTTKSHAVTQTPSAHHSLLFSLFTAGKMPSGAARHASHANVAHWLRNSMSDSRTFSLILLSDHFGQKLFWIEQWEAWMSYNPLVKKLLFIPQMIVTMELSSRGRGRMGGVNIGEFNIFQIAMRSVGRSWL